MRTTPLGASGLIVSELSLGTMIFGDDSARGTSAADADAIVHAFLDAGGNFVDTADVYVGGESERIVGRAVGEVRDEVVIATKTRFPTGDGPNDEGLSRRHILQGVEASLERLGTDYVDLLYVHAWDPVTPLEETLRALDDLVRMGAVRYLGVSNFKAWQLMKALALQDAFGYARFVAAQYQYSLVTRDVEYEFADLLLAEGLGMTPWGPLGGGFLTGKYTPGERPDEGRIAGASEEQEESWERRATERNWRIVEVAESVAEARGATVPQVAIAWLRSRPWVDSPILGVRTMAQLDDNLGAAEFDLGADELAALDDASEPPELYPYRMLEAYASREF